MRRAAATWSSIGRPSTPKGADSRPTTARSAGARVVDVQEEADEIRHLVEGPVPSPGDAVEGVIDAARRFDHTQQHTGQHLLSRLLIDRFDRPTLAFHLGRRTSTIDIPGPPLHDDEVAAVEDDFARAVREARPVTASMHDPADRDGPALRSAPKVAGPFRVISIDGYDDCPCGGTHVASTAELEVLTIVRVDKLKKDVSRVEFACGGRARRDHRARIATMRAIRRVAQTQDAEMAVAVERLVEQAREADRRARALSRELLPSRIDAMLQGAEPVGSVRLIARVVPVEAKDDLTRLGRGLAEHDHLVALVAAAEGKGQLLCVIRGPSLDARDAIRRVLAPVGGGGGGTAAVAQGGFPDEVDRQALVSAGSSVLRGLLAELEGP